VYYLSSTFKKQPAVSSGFSGIIYGYDANDLINSNKVMTSEGVIVVNKGHAVYGSTKKRETTVGLTQELDTTQAGAAGGWVD
jgi:hypothetical protein